MAYYNPMYKYSIMYVYVCLSFLPGFVFLLGSLQSPLLGQTLHFDVTLEEGVQILHSGNHWLTISTVGTRHPSVRVYDSLRQTLPHSIKMQVAALLNTKEEEIVVHHHCRLPEQKPMIACDQCQQWFHKACEAIPEAAWSSSHYNWSCSSCSN